MLSYEIDSQSNKNIRKNCNSSYPYWLLIPVIVGAIIGAMVALGVI